MSSDKNDSNRKNNRIPDLFQLTNDSLENQSGSNATNDHSNSNDAKSNAKGTKIKRQTSRSKVTKKASTKTGTTATKRKAKTDNLKIAIKNQIEEEKENESEHQPPIAATKATAKRRVKAVDNDSNKSEATSDTESAAPATLFPPPLLTTEITPIATASSATATKTTNKRLAKVLEQLNENDVLVNVRCDNKQKHTAYTSTPSGLRRRPLKAPQDVSFIGKGDNK